jgi:hypothetical protein
MTEISEGLSSSGTAHVLTFADYELLTGATELNQAPVANAVVDQRVIAGTAGPSISHRACGRRPR